MCRKTNHPAPESRPRPPPPATGLHILLVEDHADTLRVLTRLLRADGHHVVAACCAKEAAKACRKQKFDLLIADLGLPDGSGNDVMVALQKKCGAKGIALSGYGMESDIAGSRRAGFAVHATKPVELPKLRALIAQVMLG